MHTTYFSTQGCSLLRPKQVRNLCIQKQFV